MIVRKNHLVYIILFFAIAILPYDIVCAKDANITYENDNTKYQALIMDDANLLEKSQYEDLIKSMQAITEYGNVAFVTDNANELPTEDAAENIYRNLFAQNSGTLFYIDMYHRMLYIFNDGSIYKVVGKAYCNSITDNVYRYATNGDYFQCAVCVFEQELKLLQGQRISQPMKYASNALIALIVAAIINYILVRRIADKGKPTEQELMDGMFVQQRIDNYHAKFNHQTKRYSPQSSGGGGHVGGGSHRSGGGGSHRSGGGGGHRF